MKRALITLAIIVAVVVAGVQGYRVWASQQVDEEAPVRGQIVTVSRGTIEASVSATGIIQPNRQARLTFKGAGRIESIHIEKGQQVGQGDLLAELETQDTLLQIEQAKIALQIAEERLKLTKTGPKSEDLAAAEAALLAARENLARAQKGPSAGQLASAQASLVAAEERHAKLLAGPTETDLRRARLAIDQAKNSLWGAQNARDSAGFSVQLGGPRAQLDQAEAQVLNAEIGVTLAELSYQDLLKGASEADLAATLAQVEQARDAYESLLEMPRASDIAAARSQVAQAESTLAKLRAGISGEELAIAEAQVDQARVSLKQAEMLLDNSKLVAPFAGVVTSLNLKEGDLVGGATPVVSLADISDFLIEVNVDEIDVIMVQVGQPVLLTLDAIPDQDIRGHVASVANVASDAGGIVSYAVEIDVDAGDAMIRAGMSANAEITTEHKEGVLLIPNRAIRVDRNSGTYHVEKWLNGQAMDLQIVPGMRNDTYSEVVEGLAEGTELIIRNQSLTDRVGGAFGFGG